MTVNAQRSLRLIPKTDFSRLTGNKGELFYDPVNNTLRVFNGQTPGGEIIATRTWVNAAVAAIGSSSLVNGARTVSLSSNGTLTIPGDIRSEGNINIEINLSDSTLRRWQFGEDGALTFPNGTNQTTAWTGIPGPYADDEAATLAGVALGSPYHKTGTGGQVFVRLTSPS
jgi:hypothetical protein